VDQASRLFSIDETEGARDAGGNEPTVWSAVVIGGPVFNKAAGFADYIAMIVPRSFRRATIQNAMDMNFHLVDEYVLPQNSFYWPAEGGEKVPVDVATVAQVWVRSEQKREPIEKMARTLNYVSKDQANIAFRRIGARAGQIVVGDDIATTGVNSFFYIRGDESVLERLRAVDWSKIGNDVTGARSITQDDIERAIAA